MLRNSAGRILAIAALAAVIFAMAAGAQVTGLYYQEVAKEGRFYVFNTYERFQEFQKSGEMGTAITLIGRGPNGETVVAENETALDLFLFKHNLPAYDRPAPKPAPPAAAPAFPKTTIGGRVYADATSKENKDEGTDIKSADSGVGIDVKRFYFTVNHDFNSTWTAQFQSDIGDRGPGATTCSSRRPTSSSSSTTPRSSVSARRTPLGYPSSRGSRASATSSRRSPTASVSATPPSGACTSSARRSDNKLGYAFTIGNGKGYSNPTRTKSVDFEGRVSLEPIKGLTFAVGGYSGNRGNDTDATPALHTATRFNALANWVIGPVKVGGEYFTADNWNQTTKVPEDTSDGYSGWLQFTVDPRLDGVRPLRQHQPQQGPQPGPQAQLLQPRRAVEADKAADRRPRVQVRGGQGRSDHSRPGGTVSTGNGTIGSTVPGAKGTYNEIGFWFSFDF